MFWAEVSYKSAPLNFQWDLQTPELCMDELVIQDGLPLQYVREQTHEICLAATRQNELALESVNEQTHKIYLAAVT